MTGNDTNTSNTVKRKIIYTKPLDNKVTPMQNAEAQKVPKYMPLIKIAKSDGTFDYAEITMGKLAAADIADKEGAFDGVSQEELEKANIGIFQKMDNGSYKEIKLEELGEDVCLEIEGKKFGFSTLTAPQPLYRKSDMDFLGLTKQNGDLILTNTNETTQNNIQKRDIAFAILSANGNSYQEVFNILDLDLSSVKYDKQAHLERMTDIILQIKDTGISDDEILQAIKDLCRNKNNPNQLDRIAYALMVQKIFKQENEYTFSLNSGEIAQIIYING